MDTETARIANRETGEFYRRHAASFSQTRKSPWLGWKRVLEDCAPALNPAGGTEYQPAVSPCVRMLDLASGNDRFLRFAESQLPDCELHLHTVDNCAFPSEQAVSPAHTHQVLDIVDALLDEEAGGPPLAARIQTPPCDVAVCFGFFHHVPGHGARYRLLQGLVDAVRPGGFVAVSFWQFLNSDEIARKARESHAVAIDRLARQSILDPGQLDEGDYFLDWQGTRDAFRYCHSFTGGEIDELVAAIAPQAVVVDRFESDGRTGNLNAYLVLRVSS